MRLRAAVTPLRLFCALSAALALVGPSSLTTPRVAHAATNVSGTISASTTWSLANSPYVVVGDVTVASGATLTIEAGVVVKFNSTSRSLRINGSLNAVGSAGSRITFTSYQDDVGGDTNGDGASTSGAPGQWNQIRFNAGSGASTLKFVDVRFGAWGIAGSATESSGAVHVVGGSSLTIEDATIEDNQLSGLFTGAAGSYPGADVRRTVIRRNGTGVSVNMGYVWLREDTYVGLNSRDGVWFNLTGTYAGAASELMDTDVVSNGRDGVRINAQSSLPASYFPHGNRNNIYLNAQKQLWHDMVRRNGVDWTGNFWGTNVEWRANAASCETQGQQAKGRLHFLNGDPDPDPANPAGPMQHGAYTTVPDAALCGFDYFKIEQDEFERTYIGGDRADREQNFGCDSGEHGVNVSGCQNDPVNSLTGGFTKTTTDISLPGVGVPFVLQRSYNSADNLSGPLGTGWAHSYAASLIVRANGDVTVRGGTGQRVEYVKQQDSSYVGAKGALSTLTLSGGVYELTRPDQVRYRFDSSGKLLSVRDRNGQGLTLSYGGDGRLASMTDSASRSITFTHNASGLLTGVALPDGRSVSYGYTNGRLTSFTDLRGRTTSYTYDAYGWLASETDANQHIVFRNTYSRSGRVTQQLDALDKQTSFAWDFNTQTATATDARGKLWKDVYSSGRLIKRIDPLANETTYGYDPSLNRTSITDARGNTTTFTYDSRGNVLTSTAPSPLSYQEVFTYNSRNDTTTYRDGRGNTTSYGYDAAGNLTSITAPGSIVTGFGRDARGLVTSVTDPRNETTTLEYDSAGNLTATVSPLGHRETFGYDGGGRLTSRVDPRGNVSGANPNDYRTTFTHDAGDNLLTVTDPLGHVTTWAYDNVGNVSSVTDAKNHVTGYSYDAADRLTRVTAPDNTTTNYAYDDVGNLTSRADGRNNTTSYGYTDANRLATVTNPLAKTWTYTYDGNGNVTRLGDAAGAPTDYSYDALNRLSSINYSDTTPDVSYAYDGNSNRTSMADGAGTQSYVYDPLNRLTEVTRGTESFAYGYDAAGNVTRRTYPGGRVIDYSYDDSGQMSSVTSNALLTTYQYDEAGNQTQTTLPSGNGYVETRTYDRAGRLTEIRHEKSGNALAFAQYAYDQVGNPTTITTSAGVATITYDAVDRLTGATGGGMNVSYAYDAVGNRTSDTRTPGTTAYTYNAGDQLTQTNGPGGSVTYAYDANGNQTQAGSRTFTYDLANRLKSTTSSGATTAYSYDGHGVRLQAAGGSTSNFVWDVNNSIPQLALERDGVGATLRSYVIGAAGAIWMEAPSAPSYFHRDGTGSVVNLTSAAGATQWTYAYDPFGEAHTTTQNDPSAPANFVRFAGEYLDPTALYHLRARQYDSAGGRFLSLDPLPRRLRLPSISSYVYVDNRPTIFVDPLGLGPVVPGYGHPQPNPPRGYCPFDTTLACDDIGANTCGTVWCFLKDPTSISFLGRAAASVSAGCVVGAGVGASYIATPPGFYVAALFGPEVTMLFPIAGCIGSAGGAAYLHWKGYAGPNPFVIPGRG
jgi:RHS repeat-associated protein